MKHFAGLDVSVKETSVCIVDETGRICREMKVASHPGDLAEALTDPSWNLVRVGLEAGPLSQWLFSGLAEAGLPTICIETRHAKAFLKAQVNKTAVPDKRHDSVCLHLARHRHPNPHCDRLIGLGRAREQKSAASLLAAVNCPSRFVRPCCGDF